MLPDTSHHGHAEHFASLDQQVHAAHLGMWVFLASEVLLFSGLFALYAAYRLQHPEGFDLGLEHSERTIGSINTGILLMSSCAVAAAVQELRAGRRHRTLVLLGITMALGLSFTALKLYEYALHFREGIWPGAQGAFFDSVVGRAAAPFWTLYYIMTGLHVIHVSAGLSVLAWVSVKVGRGKVAPPHDHPLSLAAMYWHLVDVIWIFLWPLFYLTGKT
jgi:cytochrome c oxidase subunit 3